MAYYKMLTGYSQKARDCISRSINMAKFCGNVIDQHWAEHNQNVWFQQHVKQDNNYWVEQCLKVPDWKTSKRVECHNTNYTLSIDI